MGCVAFRRAARHKYADFGDRSGWPGAISISRGTGAYHRPAPSIASNPKNAATSQAAPGHCSLAGNALTPIRVIALRLPWRWQFPREPGNELGRSIGRDVVSRQGCAYD